MSLLRSATMSMRAMMSAMTVAAVVVAGLVSSCGCSDDPDDWESGRPQIVKLRYLQQLPQNPYALQFAITFFDDDGDLQDGVLRMSIDGSEVATLEMSDVYAAQVPPLAAGAVSGDLEVVVRLLETDIPIGQELTIGFILDEGEGDCEKSNQPTVVIKALMGGTPGG